MELSKTFAVATLIQEPFIDGLVFETRSFFNDLLIRLVVDMLIHLLLPDGVAASDHPVGDEKQSEEVSISRQVVCFLTVCYGVVDFGDNQLTCWNAFRLSLRDFR